MTSHKLAKIILSKSGSTEALRFEFSCRGEDEVDTTKKVFNTLTKFAINTETKEGEDAGKWYDIDVSLLLFYDEDKNKIVFMEKVSTTPGAALHMLPSLLLRDWKIIDSSQKDLLETYLNYHSLISNAAPRVDPNEKSWITSVFKP